MPQDDQTEGRAGSGVPEAGEGLFRALGRLAQAVGLATDPDEAMHRLCIGALEMTGAGGAYVELQVSPAGPELEVVACAGRVALPLDTRLPRPGSLTEDMVRQPVARRVEDVRSLGAPAALLLSRACPGCEALVVPLVTAAGIDGTLVLIGDGAVELSAAALSRARVLGEMASSALHRIALMTEGERRRQRLVESESRFRALAENATEAIVTIDAEDRVLFANPAVGRIFGYPAEELVGREFSMLVPERLRERHRAGIRRFRETHLRHIPWNGVELPGLRRDGSEVPLEITFSAFESGDRIMFSGIMRDITARKAAEAERERILRDEQEARLAAERAAAARDEVLGVVSHDLRDPLNTIMVSAGFLREEVADEPVRRQLDVILRSAGRMNRLIQDLLDVARLDAGALSLERRAAHPGALAHEACELIQPLASERGQAFDCQAEDGLPSVEVDRDRIHQVISNLTGNAIKFTPDGGRIRLRVCAVDGEVHFSVQDSGPGIAPENLPRVFQAHWQDPATAHLGAGLGLAIARGIVEAHGGRIWVESAPGQGATFTFALPACRE